MLQILGTLTKSDKGSIQINNQNIQKFNSKIYQNLEIGNWIYFSRTSTSAEFSALENVCLPIGFNKAPKDAEIRTKEILNELGLTVDYTTNPLIYLVENAKLPLQEH